MLMAIKDIVNGSICSYYWWIKEERGEDYAKEQLSWCIGVGIMGWFLFVIVLAIHFFTNFNLIYFWIVICVIIIFAIFIFKYWFFNSGRYLKIINESYREKYDKFKYRFLSVMFLFLPILLITGFCLIFCAKW